MGNLTSRAADRGHGGSSGTRSSPPRCLWARCSDTPPTSAPRPRVMRATPCSSTATSPSPSVRDEMRRQEQRHNDPSLSSLRRVPKSSPEDRFASRATTTEVVDRSAKLIVDTAQKTGARVSGPIPLPTERNLCCVIRSPHKDKDSRDKSSRCAPTSALTSTSSTPLQYVDSLTAVSTSPLAWTSSQALSS